MAMTTEAFRIKSLVRGLECGERTVVMLFYADGLTAKEIAEVLEITPSQVEGVLTRFRAKAAGQMDFAAAA